MADYKYQQNLFEGASYGYVKYNITPDFGTPVAPGEMITITGQAYCRNMAVKSIEVISTASGTYKSSYINKSISKGTTATFTITFPMWTLSSSWGSGRILSAPIEFKFWSAVDRSGSGNGTVNVAGQEISYLQYRISVTKRSVQFERYAQIGGVYQKNDEGTAVIGSFGISISEGRTASDITVATVKITNNGESGTQTLNIPSNVLNAALSQNGYVESVPSLFSSIQFDTAYNYTLQFTIGDAYNTCVFSVLVARAFANVHLSGCTTGGVAFGKFSASTEGSPVFECEYPAVFNAGIKGVTNYSTDEVATGGTWKDGKPIYRKIYTFSAVAGTNKTASGTGLPITGIDTVVRVEGMAKWPTNDTYVPLNYYAASSQYTAIWLSGTPQKNIMYSSSSACEITAVVFYTKTSS